MSAKAKEMGTHCIQRKGCDVTLFVSEFTGHLRCPRILIHKPLRGQMLSRAAVAFLVILLLPALALAAQFEDSTTGSEGRFPPHLGGNPNYVFAWGDGYTGDYIKRDSIRLVRHVAPTYYEISVEVAFVGNALQGNTDVGSTKLYGFEYSIDGNNARRLLYSPQDRVSWLYIDAENVRGANAERKAIGEMAYYLVFGKPFYGYLAGYNSDFYMPSGRSGVIGVALAAQDGKNQYYVCPGTIHDVSEEAFSLFVRIGPDAEHLKDYIMEFTMAEGTIYYSFYVQGQPPTWRPIAENQVYQRVYRIAERFRRASKPLRQ